MNRQGRQLEDQQAYYDTTYHKGAQATARFSSHLRRLASKMRIRKDECVLDVACGTGEWLQACRARGAQPHGVDLSSTAIDVCRSKMPGGDFRQTPADSLPFEPKSFHMVSCLGALEHFPQPDRALAEIVRVARDDARILVLVPNEGFLTRRLGLYAGTDQVKVREDVRSLENWKSLFEGNGLEVVDRWKDLHVLSRQWIVSGRRHLVPVRALQAFMLAVWPLRWQYQVYHLCRITVPRGHASPARQVVNR